MANVTIVTDVQNGFTKFGNLASPLCLEALPRILEEVRAAVDRGDRLVFTADTHRPGDPEFEMFPEHCLRGSAEAKIVEELEPFLAGADVVEKRRYSAFAGTDLDRILEDARPDVVTVVGVCTDICVLHTVAGLRNRDVRVRVPARAVATFDAPGHPAAEVQRWALGHMAGILGAEVVRSEG